MQNFFFRREPIWYAFPRDRRVRKERTGLFEMGHGVESGEKRGRQITLKDWSGGVD